MLINHFPPVATNYKYLSEISKNEKFISHKTSTTFLFTCFANPWKKYHGKSISLLEIPCITSITSLPNSQLLQNMHLSNLLLLILAFAVLMLLLVSI